MHCRLWPKAHSFQPKLLDSVTAATVACLVSSQHKVLWVPTADHTPKSRSSLFSYFLNPTPGKWVAVGDASFLESLLLFGIAPSAVVINVARRAGLCIPDIPDHVSQV